MDGFWKIKGEQTLSAPQMWRIWGKNLALEPNPFPQKRRRKSTITDYIDTKLK